MGYYLYLANTLNILFQMWTQVVGGDLRIKKLTYKLLRFLEYVIDLI